VKFVDDARGFCYTNFTKMVKAVLIMKNDILIQNITHQQIEIQITDELLRLLETIPALSNVDVYKSSYYKSNYYSSSSHNSSNFNSSDYIHDIEAHAEIDWDSSLNIICEVKTKAEPKHIRNAAHKLLEYKQRLQDETNRKYYCMIAAPYISQRAGKICEELGVGYIDLSGNCILIYKSLYVRVEGRPNKYGEKRGSKSIFERSSVKSSIILRHLFKDLEKTWRIQELADAASTSIGQVAKVKKFLEEREFIKGYKSGFSIDKPKEILAEWAKAYNAKLNTVFECYSIDNVPQIEQKLARLKEEKDIESVLTGFAGGARYSPTVRYNKIHAYVELQDFDEVIFSLGLKKVTSGSNISIIIPYDPCVLSDARNINKSFVASPVQVYLDLMGLKGRGEEAAIAVLEKEIIQ